MSLAAILWDQVEAEAIDFNIWLHKQYNAGSYVTTKYGLMPDNIAQNDLFQLAKIEHDELDQIPLKQHYFSDPKQNLTGNTLAKRLFQLFS